MTWAEAAAKGKAVSKEARKGLAVTLGDRDAAAWVIDERTGKPRRTHARENHDQIELCARCHSRRGQIRDHYEFGKPLNNTHRLALLEEHLYFPDGQIKDEVYVYGSFIQSRMYKAGVTCSDCHEPHDLKLRAEGNDLCARCHLPSRYDTEAHHHHPKGSTGSACTACHMPRRVYMVVDERADHSMRVPRPDLSVKIGTPNACNQCHQDRTAKWSADAVQRWYEKGDSEAPHFGEVLHAAQRNARDAADRLAALAGDLSQPAIARATAVERLRDHARPEHLLGVEPMLRDQDALVRAAAVRFLELADLRTRIEQGWPLLDDPARTVRLEAARVLAPVMRQRLPEIYGKKLQAALEEYATAQAVNAERPESHHNMGLLFAGRGKAKRAEQAYRAAIRIDPLFTPAYVNLADLYRQQGRDGDGEKVLRTAVSAVRDAAELHHALGLLMVRDKRMSESVVHLKRAAELAPKHTRYAYVYALALQRLGRKEHAIQVLEQALVRDDASPEVRMALASLHKARGELEAARRHLSILRKRNPNDRAAEKLWEELEQR